MSIEKNIHYYDIPYYGQNHNKYNQPKKEEIDEGLKDLKGKIDDAGNQDENISIEEKLKIISNEEFLIISKEERLQYITKNFINSKKVASGEIRNIEFSFTFDGVYNEKLGNKITVGQVLPIEVQSIKIGDIIYSRKSLDGEFFNENNNILTVDEGTKITTQKLRTQNKINEILKINKQILKEYKGTNDYVIAFEAVKRGIDPNFAILEFGEIFHKVGNYTDLAVLEFLLTEFIRGNND